MRNSSVTEPTRLLSPWALLLVVVLVGALLVLTYTGEDVFMPSEKQPDAVSISYAELLLEAHPDDTSLRFKLIEQLVELGDHARARSHVFKLAEPESDSVRFFLAELAVLEAQSVPEGISPSTLDALSDQLSAVERRSISVVQLSRLARYALALGDPALAANAYRDLATRDEAQRERWLTEAAQAYLGAGETLAAARIFTDLLASTKPPVERRVYLGKAFSAMLAADQSEQAAELIHRNIELMSAADGDLLGSAVRAGVGSHRYDLASDMVTRWRELRPDDVSAVHADLQLRLAAGELEQAWTAGQRLSALGALDTGTLELMGKLGEWTGRTNEALGFWLRLVQSRDEPAVREHAWRLASQLFDFENTIGLLAGAGKFRQLSDTELDALVYSHNARGTPEQAEHWLRNYLRVWPGHRLGWLRLQQILEQTHQHVAQVELWAEMDRRFGLTIDQRVKWAETNWELFDPQAAWLVLEDVELESVTDETFWLLRAELAWELERDADTLDAYRRLAALGVGPNSTSEERLIALYERNEPARALDVMIASWERSRTQSNLTRALQLAMELGEVGRLDRLISEGLQLPGGDQIAAIWSARAFVAARNGDRAGTEQIYLQALSLFPNVGTFREQLLWHYIDHAQREALVPLLQQWEPLARKQSGLWLPFASANLMLNRNDQALRWFDLYLRKDPDNALVQAAYADALDSAGYSDRALRLRRHVLRNFEIPVAGADLARYQTYLRLLSASGARMAAGELALRWHDGSRPMLQLWFDQFSEQLDAINQGAVKEQWLAWAQGKGLRISRYAELQQALQAHNRQTLERLLAEEGLDPAQRVEALQRLGATSRALAEGLQALSPEQPDAVQQQLRRQTLALQERNPQGVLIGLRQQDFGSIKLQGQTAELARQLDHDWHAHVSLARNSYSGSALTNVRLGDENSAEFLQTSGLNDLRPGVERSAELRLTRALDDGSIGMALDTSRHDEGGRTGLGLTRNLQLSSNDALQFQLEWHRQAEESGLLRAMGQRDALGVSGIHAISARDQFSWSLAQQRFSTLSGESVGSGQQASLELSHAVFFEGPSWTLRSGLSYARYGTSGDELRSVGVNAADLLQDRFGQAYIGSTWRRGFPGAMNRSTAQFSWIFDVLAGWQWTEQQTNYAINTGVGMQVLGDDELAFTFGFQSAPKNGDGEPGGTLGMTYSARFGR